MSVRGLAAVALLFLLFLVVVGGGIGAYFAFSPKEIPTQTYAKALLKPTVVTATSVEQGFVATAKPEPVAAPEAAVASGAKNNTRSRRGNSRSSGNKASSKKSDASKGSSNKFNFGVKKGKGGIVF